MGNERLRELLRIQSQDDRPFMKALEECGDLVNLAEEMGHTAAVDKAIELLQALESREAASHDRAQLQFFLGNAWSAKDTIESDGQAESWNWDKPESELSIIAYRRAVREQGFAALPGTQRSRILTNLANELNRIGRFVKASSTYREAVSSDPRFGMPFVNRGLAFWQYARHVHDAEHQAILAWHAHDSLVTGVQLPLEPGVEKRAVGVIEDLRHSFNPAYLDNHLNLKDRTLGDTAEEVRYRSWCLKNRLFLNPLSDCVEHSAAAHDTLHLPSMTRPLGEGPGFHGFFNQMKQEYSSARFLLYEATQSSAVHYSDRGVRLISTWDYPKYGLSVEKLRLAFRMAFAVLDKSSVFVAMYLGLKNAMTTNFRQVWFERGKPKYGLRAEFAGRENWPLRGLFWLSKDLYQGASSCGKDLDPDALDLRTIRNRMEHSYLKVVDIAPLANDGPLADKFAYFVSYEELMRKATRLLTLAREAMIYCALAIGTEESRDAARREEEGITPPMFLSDLEDDWKC